MTAWARLVPNNKISGGKVLSHKVPKGSTRLKIALRNAAQAIGQLNGTPLSDFFKRIHFRKGPVAAITATARKLLIIIHSMITKKQPYKNEQNYEYLDQKRKRKVQEMKKLIHKFDIKTNELGLQFQ
jgi:hypothetical protein